MPGTRRSQRESVYRMGWTRRTRSFFINNGNLSLTDANQLPDFELLTLHNMKMAGFPATQLVTTDERNARLKRGKRFSYALDPFQRRAKGKGYLGVLDTTGGLTVAEKACRFALHKAKSLGVHLELDPEAGAFEEFSYNDSGAVVGVRMKDGRAHFASKIIIACGGWTPSLLPELDGICETTAGSVVMLEIPRESPLFDRLAPEKFPSWTYKVRDGPEGGLYGFPRDEQGYLKIGYRGTKYTNPKVQPDGKERSVPVTRYTSGDTITQIPKQALKVIKAFLAEFLPELAQEGIDIELTRLCWYTDSFDNHFVIDTLPGRPSVMVATGGSGHAFKYLPNIGKWVADIMEGVDLNRPLIRSWRWRKLEPGIAPVNILMEGSGGPRALKNVELSTDHDLKLIQPRV